MLLSLVTIGRQQPRTLLRTPQYYTKLPLISSSHGPRSIPSTLSRFNSSTSTSTNTSTAPAAKLSAADAANYMLKTFGERSIYRDQTLDSNQIKKLCVTLDRRRLYRGDGRKSHWTVPEGAPLAPGHHLVYFTPMDTEKNLGRDGTDSTFNAPAPFTRRMWAGGRMQWTDLPLRVGESVKEVTRLLKAEPKRSRDGSEMVLVEVEKRFIGRSGVCLIDQRSWIFRPEIEIDTAAPLSSARTAITSSPAEALLKAKKSEVRDVEPQPGTQLIWEKEPGEVTEGEDEGEGEKGTVTEGEVTEGKVTESKATKGEGDVSESEVTKDEVTEGGATKGEGSSASKFLERHLSWSPVALFRFSALTFNAHMIHYNESWTRDVEGHAGGLVVHGPLNLINMLHYWWDAHFKGCPVDEVAMRIKEVSYRAMAPIYAGEEYTISTGSVVDLDNVAEEDSGAAAAVAAADHGNMLMRGENGLKRYEILVKKGDTVCMKGEIVASARKSAKQLPKRRQNERSFDTRKGS